MAEFWIPLILRLKHLRAEESIREGLMANDRVANKVSAIVPALISALNGGDKSTDQGAGAPSLSNL